MTPRQPIEVCGGGGGSCFLLVAWKLSMTFSCRTMQFFIAIRIRIRQKFCHIVFRAQFSNKCCGQEIQSIGQNFTEIGILLSFYEDDISPFLSYDISVFLGVGPRCSRGAKGKWLTEGEQPGFSLPPLPALIVNYQANGPEINDGLMLPFSFLQSPPPPTPNIYISKVVKKPGIV